MDGLFIIALSEQMKANNEFEGMRKEVVVASSEYYAGICSLGLKKRSKDLSQNSRCAGRDSNREPAEYESGALTLIHSALVNAAMNFRVP